MSDFKRDVRDFEDDAKSTLRKADGESLGDKVADAGDRLRHGVENLGDEAHEAVDDASRRAEYEHGRMDEAGRRTDLDPDGDLSRP